MTATQADALIATMSDLAENLEEAEPGETRYGVILGYYQAR